MLKSIRDLFLDNYFIKLAFSSVLIEIVQLYLILI